MTDNEIIKALECCYGENMICDECPLEYVPYCIAVLLDEAHDLIQRQQEQIKALITGQETLQKHFAEEKKRIVEQLEGLPNVNSDYWNFSDLIDREDVLEIVKGVQNE